MARTVREGERAARVNEILDAAQALIASKGYERMTIQDLLNVLQISKGAFYHYYGSKQALLEALVARMVEQVMATLRPLVESDELSAVRKLETIVRTAAGWKGERVDLLVALVRVWYADDNILVREKLSRAGMERFQALLRPVIAQGIAEGSMSTDYPDMAGTIAMDLLRGMSEGLLRCLVGWDQHGAGRRCVARCISAYSSAIERVLGLAHGTLHLADPAVFDAWGAAFSQHRGRGEGTAPPVAGGARPGDRTIIQGVRA